MEWLCGQRLTKKVSFVSSARDFFIMLLIISVFSVDVPLLPVCSSQLIVYCEVKVFVCSFCDDKLDTIIGV